jgi:hypothetical protein
MFGAQSQNYWLNRMGIPLSIASQKQSKSEGRLEEAILNTLASASTYHSVVFATTRSTTSLGVDTSSSFNKTQTEFRIRVENHLTSNTQTSNQGLKQLVTNILTSKFSTYDPSKIFWEVPLHSFPRSQRLETESSPTCRCIC